MIGGGETAASIVEEVVNHDVVDLAVISPLATIFTRAEGAFENGLYTDPTLWTTLDDADRREVIACCDRGVFSAQVQARLKGEDRVNHLRGRVTGVTDHNGLAAVHTEDGPRSSTWSSTPAATPHCGSPA